MINITRFFIALLLTVVVAIGYAICAPVLAKLDAATLRSIGEGIFIFVASLFGVAILVKKVLS